MTTLENKRQMLENAGYAYIINRLSYVNRKARKVFSIEFVEDHSEAELQDCIKERPLPTGDWHFYFNTAPSESVKRELSTILGQ